MTRTRHFPKAVLIGSASIITLALVALATQSVDLKSFFAEQTKPVVTEQNTTEASQPEHSRSETGALLNDSLVPAPAPAQVKRPAAGETAAASGKQMGLAQTYSAQPAAPADRQLAVSHEARSRIGLVPHDMPRPSVQQPGRERFASAESNPLKQVGEEPVSTFSIDVDTASYSFVRASLNAGRLPVQDAVRVEELINYFNYDYSVPESRDVPFQTSVSIVETPWNEQTRLMQIGIQGYKVPLADLPPQNLVFLIDTSGSMADAN